MESHSLKGKLEECHLLTADFERDSTVCALQARLLKNTKRLVLPSNRVHLQLCDSRKIHCLTREFHIKFHHENFTIADWLRACQLIPNSAES